MTAPARTRSPIPLLAEGIVKAFRDHVVLRGVDLSVDPGETVALVGPNGAGKSTLIGCVCGTVIADSGRVEIGGHDLASAPIEARRSLRYLPQEVDVPHGLTGHDYLRFMVDVFRSDDLRALSRRSGLGDALDRLATTYSVGMRRRLAFAGALTGLGDGAGAGHLLVLDEPFAGVDRDGRADMLDALRAITDAGVGVLLAAHDRDLESIAPLSPRSVQLA